MRGLKSTKRTSEDPYRTVEATLGATASQQLWIMDVYSFFLAGFGDHGDAGRQDRPTRIYGYP